MRTDEFLSEGLKLPEKERRLVALSLIASLPLEDQGLSEDDPELLEELERRFQDREGAVPAEELWTRDPRGALLRERVELRK